MRITGLRKLKRGNRIGVYLDGEYGFSVELNTLVREGLADGMQLSQKDVDHILFSDLVEYLYLRVIALLSRRPRSRYEVSTYIREKLRKRDGVNSPQNIESEVVAKLDRHGYLDDLQFAQVYAESLRSRKKYSPLEIRKKLTQRGIDRETIQQVLGEGSDDQQQVIAQLIAKHSSRIRSKTKTEQEYRQKMMQYLSRKGFRWDAIKNAF